MIQLSKPNLFQLLSGTGILLAFGFIVLFGILASPVFFSVDNLQSIAVQASINIVIAIGMTIVIIGGGIDISVGSILAFSSMITALLINTITPWWLPGIVGLLVGTTWGFFNGLLVGYLHLPAFVVTLGTLSLVRGLTLIISKGRPVYGMPLTIKYIGTGYIGPFRFFYLLPVLIAIVAWFFLKHTKLGQYAYAIGGNEEASKLSGINVNLCKAKFFAVSGFLSAVAGIMLVGRLGAAEPIAGGGYELDAIAAAVMGGASLMGGEGRIWGTVIGALIIASLRNILNLLNMQSFYQQVAIGAVIILAITIDHFRVK